MPTTEVGAVYLRHSVLLHHDARRTHGAWTAEVAGTDHVTVECDTAALALDDLQAVVVATGQATGLTVHPDQLPDEAADIPEQHPALPFQPDHPDRTLGQEDAA